MKGIKAAAELKQQMIDYPQYCYCFETQGKEPNCDYDSPIGVTEKLTDYHLDGTPYTFTLPMFKCKRCGKKHVLTIVCA